MGLGDASHRQARSFDVIGTEAALTRNCATTDFDLTSPEEPS